MPEQFLDEIRMPVADGASDVGDVSSLTPRERQVLGEIMAGASNKEAGRTLGISPRTIEVHRARIMEKLGAKNACDLVRIVLRQGPGTNAWQCPDSEIRTPTPHERLTRLRRRGIDRDDGVSSDSRKREWRRAAETLSVATLGGITLNWLGFPAGLVTGSLLGVATAALCGRPVHIPVPLARVISVWSEFRSAPWCRRRRSRGWWRFH